VVTSLPVGDTTARRLLVPTMDFHGPDPSGDAAGVPADGEWPPKPLIVLNMRLDSTRVE